MNPNADATHRIADSTSAARLQELRDTLDATFSVVADDGSAIMVWVVPGDLEPFFMIIDPDNLPPPETAH